MIMLLNPNTSASVTRDMIRIAAETCPEIAVDGRTAEIGDPIITNPEALATGAVAVLAMARALPSATQGVICAAFGDPGLDSLRRTLDLPVTGIGEASFLEAAEAGRPFGIVTTTPLLDDAIRARVLASGTAGHFVGCRYAVGDPATLPFQPERLMDALATAIHLSVADGARAVIIGGGPLAQAARSLAPDFDVPIVEPVPAAMRRMRRLVRR